MPIISIGKLDINVEQYGEGEPLILLMGLGGDGKLWEPHIRAYAGHFRCIAVDNRGAGKSSRPRGPYTIREMAEDVLAVMDRLALPKAHVSGISMGGAIAMELAARAPERIGALVLTATWGRSEPSTARMFETLKRLYATSEPADFARLLQMLIYVPSYINRHGARLDAEAGKERMPVEPFQAQCDACAAHDAEDRLHLIRAPVLVTAGERDVMMPLPMAQRLAERIPNSTLDVFAGGGHAFHWEQLDRYNEVTLQFLLRHRLNG